ncbi:MAG: hypothetical protein RBT71_03575 [Flavobacteriales bacterium]|jgi:hypothetical protein|nr:hypothetical protein [Flavobacteriales bacterium]
MDIATARGIALNDLHGEEYDHFGKAAYRIPAKKPGGKPGRTFMTLWIEEGFAVLMLDNDRQTQAIDLDPAAFEPYPGKWGEKGATIARLEKLGKATFRKALGMAHQHAMR